MKLVEVEDIRLIKRVRYKAEHKLPVRDYIEEFMTMNVKAVRVDYEECEYAYPTSCASSFRGSIINNRLPIDVRIINGGVYLIRKDIPHPQKNVCKKE